MPHTSGRCSNTGSLYCSLILSTSLNCGGGLDISSAVCICLTPSASHAFTRVRRALSPSPNRLETAVSERGSEWASPVGSSRTERARASRENPWVLTNGSASFSNFEELNASQMCHILRLRNIPGHGAVQSSRIEVDVD
jgi:hypothetical protein